MMTLATPLDGPEILGAKARAIASSFWSVARWLVPIWGIGIACGAVHPLGAALAAINLPLGVWTGLTLGLSLGVRESSPRVRNSLAVLAMFATAFGHVWLLRAWLSPLPDVARFFTWDPRSREAILVATVAVPTLSAITARWLTRLTSDHFDEWVGRPRRPMGGRPAAPGATGPEGSPDDQVKSGASGEPVLIRKGLPSGS